MKINYCFPLFLSIGLCFAEAPESSTDPFQSTGPSWTAAAQKEKPYTIEIAYGETEIPPSVGDLSEQMKDLSDFIDNIEVTDTFLKEAQRIKIAVKEVDTHIIQGPHGEKFILKSKKDGKRFRLQYYLEISKQLPPGASGTTKNTFNSSILLNENEWIIIGCGTSQSSSAPEESMGTTERHLDYIAIRIYKNNGTAFLNPDPIPTTQAWHVSPSKDPRSSESFILIPFDNAKEIKPGMSEDRVRSLAGGYFTTTTRMPGFPFFFTQDPEGNRYEVAVKMSDDRRVDEVSFKKWEMPAQSTDHK